MTDIDKLRAELTVRIAEPAPPLLAVALADIRALLDHIDRLEGDCGDYLENIDQLRKSVEWTKSQEALKLHNDLLARAEAAEKERDEADDRLDAARIDLLTEQSERKAAEAELARLRERLGPRGLEVVMIDGVGHYVSEAVAKEFANLRKPAGNVGEVVERLLKDQCDVGFTCGPQCSCVTARAAADLLTRLAAENAHLKAPPTDGEAGDMVKRLLMVAVIIKGEKAQVATDAADLLTRLAARVAEGERVMAFYRDEWEAVPTGYEGEADAVVPSDALRDDQGSRARNYLQKDQTNGNQ